MTELEKTIQNLRRLYALMDAPDRILFWTHFTVAPPIMIIAAIMAFGWHSVAMFICGWALWIGSKP